LLVDEDGLVVVEGVVVDVCERGLAGADHGGQGGAEHRVHSV
jgi:hypothetical protein